MRRNPLEWLCEAMLTITAIPILVMMVHVTLDVLMKYILRSPIPGTLEVVSYYYMVAIVVLPAAFVELTRQSIAVDLFYQLMPSWLQAVCVAAVLLFSAAAYGMLAWITWPDAVRSLRMNEMVMGPVDVVIWPARFLLPITMTVTAIVCLWQLFRFFSNSEARAALVRVEMPDADLGVD